MQDNDFLRQYRACTPDTLARDNRAVRRPGFMTAEAFAWRCGGPERSSGAPERVPDSTQSERALAPPLERQLSGLKCDCHFSFVFCINSGGDLIEGGYLAIQWKGLQARMMARE